MGRSEGRFGARASASGWQFNIRRKLVGGVMIAAGGSAVSELPRSTSAGSSRAAWLRSGWSLALLAVGTVALAAPIVFRSAAVNAPALRAALETMMALFALAGAWLLRVQFMSSRRLRDLVLLQAALVLGLLNLWALAVPAALNLPAERYFAAAGLSGQLFAAAVLAAAAFVSSDRLVPGRPRPIAITAICSLASMVAAGLGGVLLRHAGVVASTDWSRRSLTATLEHPLVFVVVGITTGLLAYAAIGFERRRRAESDDVAGILALAVALMVGASFSHVMPGALLPGHIGLSEGLRALAFAVVLFAAVRQEHAVRARMARGAALAERQRVARDLHDGIAQDLAFIAAHGPRFADELGEDHPVVIAAKRALAISRSTISELSDPDGASAHESLDAVAQELRDRFDIAIAVDAQLDRDLVPAAREQVSRIAREAIANAARHGHARNVVVSIRRAQNGVTLRVVDDGCGIAGSGRQNAPEGFGIRSMRERAAALGGELSVRPARRGGTELEVVLP